jgi:hypothetical protein
VELFNNDNIDNNDHNDNIDPADQQPTAQKRYVVPFYSM